MDCRGTVHFLRKRKTFSFPDRRRLEFAEILIVYGGAASGAALGPNHFDLVVWKRAFVPKNHGIKSREEEFRIAVIPVKFETRVAGMREAELIVEVDIRAVVV